jgi:predicted Ser/Thr protein kinase
LAVACLDENDFTAYFSLKLTPQETDQLFAHVDSCPACAQLFAAVAQTSEPTDGDGAADADEVQGPAPLRTLGRYHVERVLGMGGMGVVYAGHDPQLNRRVAIKLLRPGASSERQRARLMREAQAMAQLSHPNVVHVHEVGSFGEQLFVVMELIDGMTLSAWLRAQKRTWRQIVDAFVAAGEGLAAAHQAGLVHRDFKPDNVLVAGDGRICVTDFGLARWHQESSDAAPPATEVEPLATTITKAGAIMGTPAYMSPEQLRGEPADARSDMFCFCVALYEALFGTRPFSGGTVAELRAAINTQKLSGETRGVPRWLLRAVVRGLAAAPADRFPSLRELLAALRADPAPRRRRLAVALGVAAALIVAVTAYERAARRSRACVGAADKLAGIWDAPRQAELRAAFVKHGPPGALALWNGVAAQLDGYAHEWVALHTSACEATRLRGEQSEELLDLRMQCLHDRAVALRALGELFAGGGAGVIDNAAASARNLPALSDCSNAEALRAGTRLPADPALRAAIDTQLATLARARALYYSAGADETLKLASAVAAEPVAARYPPLRAEAQSLRGRALAVLQRLDEAEPLLKEAGQLALGNRQDRVAFDSWLGLATVNSWRHKIDAALEWSQMAEAVAARSGGERLELTRLHALAEIYRFANRRREETDVAERALARAEHLNPPDNFELGISLYDLGVARFLGSDFAAAAQLEQRALDVYRRRPEENLREQDRTLTALGMALGALHRYDEALAMARRSLALDEQLFPPDHPWLGYSYFNVGYAEYKRGNFTAATAAQERAEQIVAQHREALADLVAQLPALRGLIAVGLGDMARGASLLDGALTNPSLSGTDRAEIELALARARWQLGEHRRALGLATQAKADLEKETPRDPLAIAAVDTWLAEHR